MKADYFKAMRLALEAVGKDPLLQGASYEEVRKHSEKLGNEYVKRLRDMPTSLQKIKAIEKNWIGL